MIELITDLVRNTMLRIYIANCIIKNVLQAFVREYDVRYGPDGVLVPSLRSTFFRLL